MKKIIVILMLITTLLFLIGCEEMNEEIIEEIEEPLIVDEEIIEEEIIEEIILEKPQVCESNEDCPEICLDGICGSLNDLFPKKDCDVTCQLKSVLIETSDLQKITLNVNREGYTLAGALSWIVPRVEYCQGDDITIPFEIKKKQLGKIVNEQFITVKEGQTSDVITHPGMEGVKLTFVVKQIMEECK